jgi:hypothetical protein
MSDTFSAKSDPTVMKHIRNAIVENISKFDIYNLWTCYNQLISTHNDEIALQSLQRLSAFLLDFSSQFKVNQNIRSTHVAILETLVEHLDHVNLLTQICQTVRSRFYQIQELLWNFSALETTLMNSKSTRLAVTALNSFVQMPGILGLQTLDHVTNYSGGSLVVLPPREDLQMGRFRASFGISDACRRAIEEEIKYLSSYHEQLPRLESAISIELEELEASSMAHLGLPDQGAPETSGTDVMYYFGDDQESVSKTSEAPQPEQTPAPSRLSKRSGRDEIDIMEEFEERRVSGKRKRDEMASDDSPPNLDFMLEQLIAGGDHDIFESTLEALRVAKGANKQIEIVDGMSASGPSAKAAVILALRVFKGELEAQHKVLDPKVIRLWERRQDDLRIQVGKRQKVGGTA